MVVMMKVMKIIYMDESVWVDIPIPGRPGPYDGGDDDDDDEWW